MKSSKCTHKRIEEGKCLYCEEPQSIWCNHHKGTDKGNYCKVGSCGEKVVKQPIKLIWNTA